MEKRGVDVAEFLDFEGGHSFVDEGLLSLGDVVDGDGGEVRDEVPPDDLEVLTARETFDIALEELRALFCRGLVLTGLFGELCLALPAGYGGTCIAR